MTDKPKRPMSAYMLWLNSAREQIKADNPGLKVTEIAKKGGEIWRGMKDKSVSFLLPMSYLVPNPLFLYHNYWYSFSTFTSVLFPYSSLFVYRYGKKRRQRRKNSTQKI